MDELKPCPFCGQSTFVKGETEKQRQAEAIMNCGCAGARKWQNEESSIDMARAELLEVLMTDLIEQGEQPGQPLTDLLCDALPIMIRNGVSQISVLAEGVGKLTISYTGTWKIKRQRGISIERKV